jgi:hypothetical protein
MGKTTEAHRILAEKPNENIHLKDQENDGRITSRKILGR